MRAEDRVMVATYRAARARARWRLTWRLRWQVFRARRRRRTRGLDLTELAASAAARHELEARGLDVEAITAS